MRVYKGQKEIIAVLRQPSKHSAFDRKRAYLFLFTYCLGIAAIVGCSFHFFAAWTATLIIQIMLLTLSVMYALSVNDYVQVVISAVECERSCNHLMDVYTAVRLIQFLQAMWIRSYVLSGLSTVTLVVFIWRRQVGYQYVDATSLWRDVKKSETEALINIFTDVVVVIVDITMMVFSAIDQYT